MNPPAIKVFILGAGRVGRAIGRAIVDQAARRQTPARNPSPTEASTAAPPSGDEADPAAPPSGDEADPAALYLIGAWTRTPAAAIATAALLGVEITSGPPLPDLQAAVLIIMSVPDDAIADLAARLAPLLTPDQILLHTSGSHPASTMASDAMRAHLGGVHPLQALADPHGDPDLLRGATFAVEGDPEAIDAARLVALAVGGNPVAIPSEAKVFYHAAAVVSANYITVLVDAARDLLAEAGVDARAGIQMLMPLLKGTLDNLQHLNDNPTDDPHDPGLRALSMALTGPVRRGDVGTVRRHLDAIDDLARRRPEAADLPALYRLLAARAAAIARRGDLPDDLADALDRALKRSKT